MSRILVVSSAAITLGILCSAAHAQSLTGSSPGFHYFYKRGAGMDRHDEDLVACAVATRALVNGSDAMNEMAAATGGGLVGALIGSVIDNNENRQGQAANTENCMALHGWSVIGMTRDQGEAIEQPDDPASIHAKIAPLVDAAEPGGPVLRGPFANELAEGDFSVDQAEDLEEVSLSVRAVADQTKAAVEAAGKMKPPKPTNLPKGVRAPKPAKTMTAEALAAADSAKSYVILRLAGDPLRLNAGSVRLERLAADGTEVIYDGEVTAAALGAMNGPKVGKARGGDEKRFDFAVELPPGLWKIAGFSYGAFYGDLCFGAPAFELRAGETIYLGEMHLQKSGGYHLSSDIEAAKEILAAAPALAEKVKEPEFSNGFLSDCFGSYAYAYEVPGAPFVDMPTLKREAEEAKAAAEAAEAASSAEEETEADLEEPAPDQE